MTTHRTALALLLVCPLLASCGTAGPERRAVEGTVLLDGKPLEQGLVHFEPVDGGGHNASTTVENGQFTLELHGGLPDGEYAAAVSSQVRADGKTGKQTAEEAMTNGAVEYVERIAPEYNVDTKLRIEISRTDQKQILLEVESAKPRT